jgi:ABC-type microcin C transport system duplicated ATPase subunit YejF
MAKVVVHIPEPKQEYDVSNQRQIVEALNTVKNQLNFSYQDDLRKEMERFTWYNMRFGC